MTKLEKQMFFKKALHYFPKEFITGTAEMAEEVEKGSSQELVGQSA